MPADPNALEFFRIAAGRHDVFHVIQRKAFPLRAVRTPLPFPVVAFERSDNLRELGLFGWIARSGNIDGVLQQIDLSRHILGQLQVFVALGFGRKIGSGRLYDLVGLSGEDFSIVGDEGLVDPLGSTRTNPQV
jgi:hypothetical protein